MFFQLSSVHLYLAYLIVSFTSLLTSLYCLQALREVCIRCFKHWSSVSYCSQGWSFLCLRGDSRQFIRQLLHVSSLCVFCKEFGVTVQEVGGCIRPASKCFLLFCDVGFFYFFKVKSDVRISLKAVFKRV